LICCKYDFVLCSSGTGKLGRNTSQGCFKVLIIVGFKEQQQLALQMGLQLAPINNHINTYDAQSGLVNV
jgi:hypothetical protein